MGSKVTGIVSGQTVQTVETPTSDGAAIRSGAAPQRGFEQDLHEALAKSDIREARRLVAAEEQRVFELPPDARQNGPAGIAAAKVRIAMETGDGVAAQAILVAAIEMSPENRSLRVLMSEVMLATGRASDARPVLQHIGKVSTDIEPEDDAAAKRRL